MNTKTLAPTLTVNEAIHTAQDYERIFPDTAGVRPAIILGREILRLRAEMFEHCANLARLPCYGDDKMDQAEVIDEATRFRKAFLMPPNPCCA